MQKSPGPVAELTFARSEHRGLTKGDTKIVKPARVAESLFSVECKLMEYKLLNNTAGQQTGGYVVLGESYEGASRACAKTRRLIAFSPAEGVMFHIREDAMDAERITCDQAVLKNVVRMGGITYGRVTAGFELPRPFWSA